MITTDNTQTLVNALAEIERLKAANGDLQAWYDAAIADAKRYQLVRRGQHWSIIDGAGNTLRAEALDEAADKVLMKGEKS